MTTKKTELFETHKSLSAKIVPFAGWEMPVQYSGIIAEHNNVRKKCGLFDVSHMGEVIIRGAEAQNWLNSILTNDIRKIQISQAQYNLMLYPNGTVVDDVIVYKVSEVEFFICLNASNCEKDLSWLKEHAGESIEVIDVSMAYSQIALQGPTSFSVLSQTNWGKDLYKSLKPFYFLDIPFGGSNIRVARTGYTGEDGVEIFVPSQNAQKLWAELYSAGQAFGLLPVGLGARDSLRLEAGLPLYGHEISDSINPLEAGLAWVIKLDKGDFIGKESLIQWQELQEIEKRGLVGLISEDRRIARQDHIVYEDESMTKMIGKVASGTFSPSLGKPVATALLRKGDRSKVFISIREQAVPYDITNKRFLSKKIIKEIP